MNIKTIIAAVVALTASPLALASGHTMEFYVGGDMGQVSLNDHEDDCDALLGRYTGTTVTMTGVTTNLTVEARFPAADAATLPTGVRKSAKGSCEDSALAPRMVVGYKINDMFSVEGFFGWASGFDNVVNAAPNHFSNPSNFTAGFVAGTVNYLAYEDKTEVDYSYFGLVLNGQYEVSRGIMVGGKIGIQQASADATRTVNWSHDLPGTASQDPTALRNRISAVRNVFEGLTARDKESKTEAIYGIGAAYQITDEFSVRAGYDLSGVSNYMHGGVTYSLSF